MMPNYSSALRRCLVRSLPIVSLATLTFACSAPQANLSGSTSSLMAATVTKPFPDPAIGSSIATTTTTKGEQTAVLAGGCFWGMEAVFEHLKGVSNVVSGFAGGSPKTAHYLEVSTGLTGHAESVKITYDPSQISYGELLKVYFSVAHDPTELNRQGPDEGTQYRSAIFFTNDEQKQIAQAYINQLNKAHIFKSAIVTQVVPLSGFYAAEEYHQNFIDRNPNYPYVVVNDLPKLEQLQAQFPNLYKKN